MKDQFIIALDQGTTSSRAVLFDQKANIVDISQKEFTQYFPQSGWVEHDAEEIWQTQKEMLFQLLKSNALDLKKLAAIGITNQRETAIVWDKGTGKPIHNAIVWQDTRTLDICEKLEEEGMAGYIKERTGLVIDTYFSATKIKWLLDKVEGARDKAKNGELLFGTVDSWLIWKLTKGKVHATDYTNASRTMLYDINKLDWDDKLLEVMDIPRSILPEVRPSSGDFGQVEIEGVKIPIQGVAGDQQAALFGQACFEPGLAKNTYGTGCFMLMNTGTKPHISKNGLITTIAWGIDNEITYALEGSIFIAGAAVQWLRDGLKIIDAAADSEFFAKKAGDAYGVYVVPAFAGLGAPYWDMYARGAIFGLTRDTGKEHVIKATLESLAYQTKDVSDAMQEDAEIELNTLNVDGGASANDLLMQFQADILNVTVERPETIESTALGAAYLAGIAAGLWSQEDIVQNRKINKRFEPHMEQEIRDKILKGWKKAVKRSMGWLKDEK